MHELIPPNIKKGCFANVVSLPANVIKTGFLAALPPGASNNIRFSLAMSGSAGILASLHTWRGNLRATACHHRLALALSCHLRQAAKVL